MDKSCCNSRRLNVTNGFAKIRLCIDKSINATEKIANPKRLKWYGVWIVERDKTKIML